MQRHLGNNGLDSVFDKLLEKTFISKIETFRKRNLLKETDLPNLKSEIIYLFKDLSKTQFKNMNGKSKYLGSTTASKVLHLCCPDFFVMWDSYIEYGNGTGDDYFQFLNEMRDLWNALQQVVSELEKIYCKRATRIIDEFNWFEWHPSER